MKMKYVNNADLKKLTGHQRLRGKGPETEMSDDLGSDLSETTQSQPANGTGASVRMRGQAEDIPFDLIELLFFAYRDFVSDPDRILEEYGFGRAHHRVLHFVNRRAGLTIATCSIFSRSPNKASIACSKS